MAIRFTLMLGIGQAAKIVMQQKHPDIIRVFLFEWFEANVYRLENWNFRRAPRWPYFLRSFIRLSRVRNLEPRRATSSEGSYLAKARPRPMTIAPAWPVWPPPVAFTSTSILPPVLV